MSKNLLLHNKTLGRHLSHEMNELFIATLHRSNDVLIIESQNIQSKKNQESSTVSVSHFDVIFP